MYRIPKALFLMTALSLSGSLAHAQSIDTSRGSIPTVSLPDETTTPQNIKPQNKTVALNVPSQEGQNLKSSLIFCSATQDNGARLSCYDDLAQKTGGTTHAEVHTTLQGIKEWAVQNDTNNSDFIAALGSYNTTDINGNKKDDHLTLFVRCKSQVASLYFKDGSNFGTHPISVAIIDGDSGNSNTYQMDVSKSGEAFGIWSRDNVRNMLNYIRNSGTIILHYQVGTTPEISTHFNVSQTTDATLNIKRACNL